MNVLTRTIQMPDSTLKELAKVARFAYYYAPRAFLEQSGGSAACAAFLPLEIMGGRARDFRVATVTVPAKYHDRLRGDVIANMSRAIDSVLPTLPKTMEGSVDARRLRQLGNLLWVFDEQLRNAVESYCGRFGDVTDIATDEVIGWEPTFVSPGLYGENTLAWIKGQCKSRRVTMPGLLDRKKADDGPHWWFQWSDLDRVN